MLHADNSCVADTGLACGLHCLLSATHAPSMQSRPLCTNCANDGSTAMQETAEFVHGLAAR